MKRFLTMGLLASTVLAVAMPAAAQRGEGRDRGDRTGGSRQQQSADPGDGPRNWSPRDQRAAPTQQAPAPQAQQAPQRVAPAVTNRQVPPSAVADGMRDQRGYVPRPGTPNAQANGQTPQRWSGDRDRATRPAQPTAPQVQPGNGGNWQRDARRNDNDRNGNDRGRDWRNNDRNNDQARNDRDRNWQNGDRGRNYGYQGRLQDRDRWADQRRWSNNWRNDRRYDWQSYRTQNRNIYRLPSYYAPYGWNRGYSRFSIGIFLSNVLFDQSYWIDDPYEYRLPPAYGSMRWVRYYDDALLVDIRDGYVVDVIHGFFW
jgi:Ni/Co efflux regulator RcnB